jgi:hypothetical protein
VSFFLGGVRTSLPDDDGLGEESPDDSSFSPLPNSEKHPKSQILNDQHSLFAFRDSLTACSESAVFYGSSRSVEEGRNETNTQLEGV